MTASDIRSAICRYCAKGMPLVDGIHQREFGANMECGTDDSYPCAAAGLNRVMPELISAMNDRETLGAAGCMSATADDLALFVEDHRRLVHIALNGLPSAGWATDRVVDPEIEETWPDALRRKIDATRENA